MNDLKYIPRESAINALQKMRHFHDQLAALYSKFNINLLKNTGRRNMLMSHTQEKFFAEELSLIFPKASSDGRTGCADIIIPELGKELECKLTSGSGKYLSFDLQTDWETISRKEKLDYLYVLASKDFSEFVVLFFSGLMPSDFFPPSPGARGKSRMNKTLAMKKCHVLVGDISTRNQEEIEKIILKINNLKIEKKDRLSEINQRLDNVSKNAIKRHKFLKDLSKKERLRFRNKLEKLKEKQAYWECTHTRFKFTFEPIIMNNGSQSFNS